MKTRTGSARGSVLVMVVGLLTIIAMLGSVFLLVARLNRRTADALDAAAPDSLVAGIVDQVKAQMLADLHIGEYNPTGADEAAKNLPYFGTGVVPVEAYADFPGNSDAWLASNYTASVWESKIWPHITSINSEASGDVTGVPVNRANLRDTDSDGLADAILYRMEVFNSNGDEYCAAVRVIDLGGLICVNTGGQLDGTPYPAFLTPVSINLKGFLGDTLYEALCNGRKSSDDMAALWTNLASHPSSPVSPYVAFGVGDEMYLRWLTSSTNASTFTGPLYDATRTGEAALPIQVRRFLTTQGASRNLLRRPRPNLTTRIPLRTTDFFDDATVVGASTLGELRRTALYEMMVDILGGGGAGQDDLKKMAAHFVVNLWAYMDGQQQGKAYAFTPASADANYNPDATFTAYGIVRQPVLSEAYAKGQVLVDDPRDFKEVQAVEIFNPHGTAMSGTGYTYVLITNGGEIALGGNAGRLVYYSTQGDPDAAFFPPPSGATNTADVAVGTPGNIDFQGGVNMGLVRRVTVGAGTVDIPVDTLGLAYTPPADNAAGVVEVDVSRDDSTERNRYYVAETEDATASLGESNNVADTDLDNVFQGFDIPQKDGTNGITSVGETMDMYLYGPISVGTPTPVLTSLPERLAGVANNPNRGRANAVTGAQAAGSANYPSGTLGAVLGELFTVIPLVDPSSDPIDSRVYGRLNINTATKETLLMLPWPARVNSATDNINADKKNAIVTAIITARGTAGFTTPGQLATVLGDYFDEPENGLIGTLTTSSSNYLEERGKLYKAVADLITVNSDVYAITMRVNLEDTRGVVKYGWNYISVIDRGSCFKPSDTPNPILPADKVK